MTAADEEDIIERLKAYLEKRLATRRALLEDHENKEMKFRDLLLNMEQEGVLLRYLIFSLEELDGSMFPLAARHTAQGFILPKMIF